ncbi:hypothetical protein PybrP1_005649 [[Pythium] brassicae (nom. inval.)]|nr:hypothetical protein PybrP1_005649 [[Pythium] brassicae (nom. inval.)]
MTGEGGGHKTTTSKLWFVGVILSILGSVMTNMGVNLQNGLDFVALGFMPQSLATPVGGSTMVANVAFASLFLKEKFGRRDAMGTGLVLAGICVVAAFAEKESASYTVDELVALYQEPSFIVYCVLAALASLGVFVLVKRIEKLQHTFGTSSPKYKRFARVHPVCYPALSGIFGAQSILFAKSVAELIKTTAEGTNQFLKVGTYMITLSMFACIFLQIHWLAFGLQFFDAVFIVPVFQCFFISVSIFGGGVYFKEFSKMSALALGMFFFGAAITLSGVFLLSRREMNTLRPLGRLRAAVKMVIFIKRAQKARNIEHRWVLPAGGDCAGLAASPRAGKPAQPKSIASGLKLSKASVMPVDSSRFPGPASSTSTLEIACCSLREKNSTEDAVPRTALDSSFSRIESPPPPPPPPPNSDASSAKSVGAGKTSSSSKTNYN